LQDRLFPIYVNVTSFSRIPGVPSLGHGFPLLAPGALMLADLSSVDAVSCSYLLDFDLISLPMISWTLADVWFDDRAMVCRISLQAA
jgi:hypothetical protein